MTPQTFDRTMRAIKQVGFPIVAATALGVAGHGWINEIILSQGKMAEAQNDFVRGMLAIEKQNSKSIQIHAEAAQTTADLLVDIRAEASATTEGVQALARKHDQAMQQQQDTANRFERIITALEGMKPDGT